MSASAETFGFGYSRNALAHEIEELARDIAPVETAALDDETRRTLLPRLMVAAVRCRTYVARLDGRLAGICFIEDLPDRREMAFAKTRYLAEKRRFAFARGLGQLLAALAALEAEAHADARPMYMHVPEGDGKSAAWFVRAGLKMTPRGLLVKEGREGRP